MKSSPSTLWLALVLTTSAGWTKADPLDSCGDQKHCLHFSVSEESNSDLCPGDCSYKVCMALDLDSYLCAKDAHETVSHTCLKDPSSCVTSEGFALATEVQDLANGYEQCQTVPAGGVAEFLLKDGNAQQGCGYATKFVHGIEQDADCETYVPDANHHQAHSGGSGDSGGSHSSSGSGSGSGSSSSSDIFVDVFSRYKDGSCTGNGNRNKECVWRVPVPDQCGEATSGPTSAPTNTTSSPSAFPTKSPVVTALPTAEPTGTNTTQPTSGPSSTPSSFPSDLPSSVPSFPPTFQDSNAPSNYPTLTNSSVPSGFPSEFPSDFPSSFPTQTPSLLPTSQNSNAPSNYPTLTNTSFPSDFPSQVPSVLPTRRDSDAPSAVPSNSELPSTYPSDVPSSVPSFGS